MKLIKMVFKITLRPRFWIELKHCANTKTYCMFWNVICHFSVEPFAIISDPYSVMHNLKMSILATWFCSLNDTQNRLHCCWKLSGMTSVWGESTAAMRLFPLNVHVGFWDRLVNVHQLSEYHDLCWIFLVYRDQPVCQFFYKAQMTDSFTGLRH
jgi:hypothetical protein